MDVAITRPVRGRHTRVCTGKAANPYARMRTVGGFFLRFKLAADDNDRSSHESDCRLASQR
jgi:hypothetical protein